MTETTTLTISDFLLARIAEDEERAQVAVQRRPAVTSTRVDGVWLNNRYHLTVDPARVLAECEAKRAIVSSLTAPSRSWGAEGEYALGVARDRALRALASVYADHPSYRAEWAL